MSRRDRRTQEVAWRPVIGSVTEEETGILLALLALPKMGPARLDALIGDRGPAAAWELVVGFPATATALPGRDLLRGDPERLLGLWHHHAHGVDPAGLLARHREAGVEVLAYGSTRYPARLIEDREPPLVLFSHGDVAAVQASSVAIVGTRRCSPYGAGVAREWGAALAAAGVTVLSGLARGVDALTHTGALEAGGAPPVAVVGTGLDVIYPRSSRRLWHAVASSGAVLSEAPLGVRPEPWRFPARNRILAALADAVVVVESDEVGGSMITATEALERDRMVFAVPGSVRSPLSRGPNRLLAAGAQVACDPTDILTGVGLVTSARSVPSDPAARIAAPDQRAVLDLVGWETVSVERIADTLDWSLGRTFVALEELVGAGVLVKTGAVVRRT